MLSRAEGGHGGGADAHHGRATPGRRLHGAVHDDPRHARPATAAARRRATRQRPRRARDPVGAAPRRVVSSRKYDTQADRKPALGCALLRPVGLIITPPTARQPGIGN